MNKLRRNLSLLLKITKKKIDFKGMKKELSNSSLNLCEDVEVPEMQEALDQKIKNEEKRDATKLPLLLHLR